MSPVRSGPARVALALAVILLATAAAGVPLGLLWARFAPTVPVLMTENGAILTDPQPEQFAASDGWFVLLGFGLGVLAALLAWWLAPSTRGVLGVAAVGLGSLAAGYLAWRLGRHVGLARYEELLDSAAVGQRFAKPADLRIARDVVVPAFGAAAMYTLLAGWSRYPTLRRGGDEDSIGSEYPPDIGYLATDGTTPAGHAPVARVNGAERQDVSGRAGGRLNWDERAPQAPRGAPAPPGPGAAEPPPG